MKNNCGISQHYKFVANIASDRRSLLKRSLQIFLVAALIVWSLKNVGFSLKELIQGLDGIVDIVGRMLPPKTDKWRGLVKPVVETVNISIIGTFIATIIAVPLGSWLLKTSAPMVSFIV